MTQNISDLAKESDNLARPYLKEAAKEIRRIIEYMPELGMYAFNYSLAVKSLAVAVGQMILNKTGDDLIGQDELEQISILVDLAIKEALNQKRDRDLDHKE